MCCVVHVSSSLSLNLSFGVANLQEPDSGCCCWQCSIAGKLSSTSAISMVRHALPTLLSFLSVSWQLRCKPSEHHRLGTASGTRTKQGNILRLRVYRAHATHHLCYALRSSKPWLALCVTYSRLPVMPLLDQSQAQHVLLIEWLCLWTPLLHACAGKKQLPSMISEQRCRV